MNLKNTAIFLILVVFISSCTPVPSQRIGMQQRTMNSNTYDTAIDRNIEGLKGAKISEIAEIQDLQTFNLEAKPVWKEINGNKIKMYAYNGQIPGPLLKVKQGSTIYVNFTNNMELETTIHWHGLRHDFKFDGVEGISQEPVTPGQSFLYKLSFPDAGIFWYHPHMREDLQQELGLYGNMIVEPKDEKYFNKVNREVALFLDDIMISGNDVAAFSGQKATFTLMGRFGNVMLLNGETAYNLDAKKGDIARLYLTDSANTRPFNFQIEGHKLKLVGSDIGKFEKEDFVDSVIILPGERYIVEVLFDKAGEYDILHKTPIKTYTLGKISVAESGDIARQDFLKIKSNDEIKADIDKFRKYFDSKPDYEFELTLSQNVMSGMSMSDSEPIEWEDIGHSAMMNRMSDSDNIKWIIKDLKTGKENMDIKYNVKLGDVKKIRFISRKDSMHPMQHPMHLHGQRFLILSTDGKQNKNLVWKDTVLVPAGKTVDILVDFSNLGEWVMHCHISEHLEAGMMSKFEVV